MRGSELERRDDLDRGEGSCLSKLLAALQVLAKTNSVLSSNPQEQSHALGRSCGVEGQRRLWGRCRDLEFAS